jgi:hypothetical protein
LLPVLVDDLGQVYFFHFGLVEPFNAIYFDQTLLLLGELVLNGFRLLFLELFFYESLVLYVPTFLLLSWLRFFGSFFIHERLLLEGKFRLLYIVFVGFG